MQMQENNTTEFDIVCLCQIDYENCHVSNHNCVCYIYGYQKCRVKGALEHTTCGCAKFGRENCGYLDHACVCDTQGPLACFSDTDSRTHKCICVSNRDLCLYKSHRCTCLVEKSVLCKSNNHGCVCLFNYGECRNQTQCDCTCQVDILKCRAGIRSHSCTCDEDRRNCRSFKCLRR